MVSVRSSSLVKCAPPRHLDLFGARRGRNLPARSTPQMTTARSRRECAPP